MKFSIPPLIRITFALAGTSALHRLLPLTLGVLVNATLLHGQQSKSGADSLTQTIQGLLQRVEQLVSHTIGRVCRCTIVARPRQEM